MRPGRFKIVNLIARSGLLLCLITIGTVYLSGCMYPKERRQEKVVTYRESVERIQRAMDQFQEEQGILPIITAGIETPRYEKYIIDLDQLNRKGYIDEIPDTAFEKGGSAYFLVINEEIDPRVKVMDLNTVQRVNDVQRLVDKYRASHGNELPAVDGKETYPGLYTVDLPQIAGKDYPLRSVFSGETLPYLMNGKGQVFVDYAVDIMQAVDKAGIKPEGDEDLRLILVDQSYFVPVKSLSYHWVKGLPVPQVE
ncbi:hypothetical protein J2T12_001534 [Paenibacillus anaericanus]|uniref:hypothetical protein n=1 Tax=Paenibacillus anaericanus TaxID=170367 RepID=UPI002785B68D|nr:hypothetical protein [Paenibacillus anaericanus]MDQ0088128.1 hypothetical protein [Paenibacillus anaericanus]